MYHAILILDKGFVMDKIFTEAARLEQEHRLFALVTIIRVKGSTPRSEGRMIVLADGKSIGTVGGGISEYEAIKEAVRLIQLRQSDTICVDLSVGTGHQCGGTVELFIDVVSPSKRMVLFGGGHVNQAIAKIARTCDFSTELVETRSEFADDKLFDRIHLGSTVEAALSDVVIDEHTVVVIATHGMDKEVLQHVIPSKAAYIGMLGSRKKVDAYLRYLKEEKQIAPMHLDTLFAPIGLDIGSETPEEIAVSVMGEVLKVLRGGSGQSLKKKESELVIVRGAGDIATGIIHRLHKAGYRVLALEIDKPTTIRRTVAFSEAVYERSTVVEGVECRLANTEEEALNFIDQGDVALLCDQKGDSIRSMRPLVVVDAIIAKRNLTTNPSMAPLVIALGPGFTAPVDCHVVIETQRGHDLGRIIIEGSAQENTGIPGMIGNYAEQRVLHSHVEGCFIGKASIGDMVHAGDIIAHIDSTAVTATIDGVLRGLLHDGLHVPVGCKIADIDPRGKPEYCRSMSDKARALGGAVLEVIDRMIHKELP